MQQLYCITLPESNLIKPVASILDKNPSVFVNWFSFPNGGTIFVESTVRSKQIYEFLKPAVEGRNIVITKVSSDYYGILPDPYWSRFYPYGKSDN